jgi:hypothetical protein
LKFVPTGHKPELPANLTERRFRDQWKQTKGKEAERFAALPGPVRF